jgi:hypothetical protein
MYRRRRNVQIIKKYIVLSEVGGPKISSANCKSTNRGLIKFVRLADLPKMWQYVDLRFANLIFLQFADLQIAKQIFCGLKTSANPQYIIFPFKILTDQICMN